jgi:DNA-binding transcriptional MocR family regulator
MVDMADVPDVLRKIVPRNDSTKLSDRVASEIEHLILSGELREREKLPTEAELCQAFGVSRSVIRDAVRTLSARGLVHVQHGQGTVIDPPGEGTVANALILYLLRSDLTIHDKGMIRVKGTGDDVMLQAIDAGTDDVQEEGEESVIYTAPQDLAKVRDMLKDAGLEILELSSPMFRKHR